MNIREREALQEQSDSAELYILTFGSAIYRFTSYFEQIYVPHPYPINGDLYEAIPVQREGISYGSDLSDITVKIELAVTTDIGALFKNTTTIQDALIEIRKYFLADMTTYDVVFSGCIVNMEIDRGVVKLNCASWLDNINRDFPRKRFQNTCNNMLFDSACTLTKSNWKITGTVSLVDGNSVTVTYTLPGGYPTYKRYDATTSSFITETPPVPGFFTNGIFQRNGERRVIMRDSAGATSAVLELHFPVKGLAAGNTVYLYPGCNKMFPSPGLSASLVPACVNFCSSFSNTDYFLGMELIPYKNPSITPVAV